MKNSTLLKKAIAFAAIIVMITTGCKRAEIPVTPDPIPTTNAGGVVDDLAQVTASVSGIVLDESNTPIVNAVVTSGVGTTTTNSNGMFILNNISLSKENGNVTVVKAGYFKGIRSFKTTAGKNHSIRLQLMARILSGTVNATNGGTINANGGATITFPAAVFVTSAGAAYTGTVNVYSRWIDPTAANLPFVIPGDLRGVSTNGVENILETYGMVGAELEDGAGNALKIATGKKATISFPIPASLATTAPASIVLWHFDEATARWKQNGTATKAGSTYTAQVDKFSFWNVDVPNASFINLDYTLINATTNSPLVFTSTRIKRISNGTYGYGITNNAGFVSGLVPKNEALVLEVVSATPGCNTVIYSQNIGPFASNMSLGNINVTIPSSQLVNFSGTLLNCTGGLVTNGYVLISISGGYGGYAALNANGAFSLSTPYCGGNSFTYTYQGTDYSTSQQSPVSTGTASTGSIVNLSNLIACGIAASEDVYVGTQNYPGGLWKNGILNFNAEYVNSIFVVNNDVYATGQATTNGSAIVWKNGVATSLSTPTSARANSIFVTGTDVYCVGEERLNIVGSYYYARLWKNGVASSLMVSSSISNLGTNASSVFIQGLDVYAAGNTSDGIFGTVIAGFWKNGVFTSLNNGTGNWAKASSIFVFNNDVYVAGVLKETQNGPSRAVYWKNGIPVFLTTTTEEGEATSIYVSQGDVYVGGRIGSGGNYNFVYWKNGTATNLMTTIQGNSNQRINSIFVKNNNVYATGFFISNNQIYSKVWKNGVDMNFFNQNINTIATSIFVK
jgi:hypothetical protein